VRVEANRITEVTPGAVPPPARGATVIDAGGAPDARPRRVPRAPRLRGHDLQELTRLPPEEHMLVTVRNATLMLDCGYTSAFSAASPKPRLDVVLKREIEAGRVPGRGCSPTVRRSPSPAVSADTNIGCTCRTHETPTFCWVAEPAPSRSAACAGCSRARASTC